MWKNKIYGNDNGFVGCLTYFVITIALYLVLSFVFALPVKWLWNWLMPTLFNLPIITWIQSWGLSLLLSLLFSKVNVNNKQ